MQLLSAALVAWMTTGVDGTVLTREPFALKASYEQQDELTKFRFSRKEFDETKSERRYVGERLTYLSDGLKIVGFYYHPRGRTIPPRPTIIFCRGGNRDFGAIEATDLIVFRHWAEAGFNVLATQYRGGGGSEGNDEYGGSDVNDVMNLVSVARNVGGCDLDNLYLVGQSRGGIMVYEAVRRGISVRAAAVISGVSDLRNFVNDDPGWINGDDEFPGFRHMWPDYEHRAEEHFRSRSAVLWANELKVPILMLATRTDPKVTPLDSLHLAEKLHEAGREYELVIYGTDGHSLPVHRIDRDEHITGWFRAHRKGAKP